MSFFEAVQTFGGVALVIFFMACGPTRKEYNRTPEARRKY